MDKDYQLVDLFHDCNRALFSAAQSSKHSLNHLFQVKQHHSHQMSLRPRGYNFELPLLKYELARKSFISRSLFLYI